MADEHDGLPRVHVRERGDAEVRLMRALQAVALEHPLAAQAAVSALIAEGRRFAVTPEGARWRDALVHSTLLHRARLAWETTTLVMLQEEPPDVLPTAYLDALFMMAGSRDLGRVGTGFSGWEHPRRRNAPDGGRWQRTGAMQLRGRGPRPRRCGCPAI